jgi:hypothetical protein
MMARLSTRERKLVALLLLVGALFAVWYGVLAPLIGGFVDRAAARQALIESYQRDARAVAQIPSIRRAAEAQRASAEKFVMPGANPGDALRDRVAAAVVASGGALKTIEDVAGTPATVRVRADSQLTIPQLNALLAGLAQGTPLLVVDALSVAADEAFQTNRPGQMDVRLEISARIAAPKPR